jgi:hypothetical protein
MGSGGWEEYQHRTPNPFGIRVFCRGRILTDIKLELPEAPKSHDAKGLASRISLLRWIAGDQLAWLSVVYPDMLRIVQTDSSILLRTRERLHSLTYSVVAFSSPYSSLETLQACSQQTGGASAKRRCTTDGMWETQGVEEGRKRAGWIDI